MLAGLVLVGLTLRIAAIDRGIGLREFEGYYNSGELKVSRSTEGFPGIYLTNESYLYGTALQYSVGFVLYPVKRLWRLGYRGPLYGLDYKQLVILSHRAVNAILGALTIFLVYRLGRRVYDGRTGVLAAGLLSFSSYHVTNSGLATLDVPMGFLTVGTILLAARAFETGRQRDFLLLGLVVGFLAATKISGVLILAVPSVLLVHEAVKPSEPIPADEEGSPAKLFRKRSRTVDLGTKLVLSGIAAAIVFAISTPHAVLRFRAYLDSMLEQRLMWVAPADHSLPAVVREWVTDTAVAMTPVVATLAGIGFLWGRVGVRRNRRVLEYAMLAYLLANVLFWRGYLGPRFLMPLVPILFVYAARPPILLMRRQNRLLRAGGALMAIAALAVSVYASIAGVLYQREPDPRTLASAYIAEHVSAGATLALASTTADNPWTMHSWRYPKIDTTKYSLTSVLENPEYVLTTSYVLDQMERALASGQLDSNFNWPPELASRWYMYRVPEPEEFIFFNSLLKGESYFIEASWRNPPPVPVELPAPEIRLYRAQTAPSLVFPDLPTSWELLTPAEPCQEPALRFRTWPHTLTTRRCLAGLRSPKREF